jgi:hypothetical protein
VAFPLSHSEFVSRQVLGGSKVVPKAFLLEPDHEQKVIEVAIFVFVQFIVEILSAGIAIFLASARELGSGES